MSENISREREISSSLQQKHKISEDSKDAKQAGELAEKITAFVPEVENLEYKLGELKSPHDHDKMLEELSSGNTAFVFLFIGIDIENSIVTSSTVSIFDESIIAGTRKQDHWSGRDSRGTTQLRGDTIESIFSDSFQERIVRGNSKKFLRWLMEPSN